MEVVLICFPLVTSMLPCTLAFLWKQRNGLPWFLLSVVSTYPIAVGYLRHVTEAIGGNPMGGTKAGILLASALLSAIAVSMVVAFIPKNRTHQKYRFPLKKKTVLQIIGITAVTLTILAVVLRAKMISYEQDLQLAMQYPQQAAEKALAEGNSSLLREAVNYWSHDDPAATLDWLESNIDDKESGGCRAFKG